MVFKSARCPNCSGELSLDPSVKKGFCMHCGSEIIVKEAIKIVQVDGVASADNLLEMAQRSKDMGSYSEAFNYYSKYLELIPDNYKALYEKSLLLGFQSTSDNNRIKEAMKGVKIAINEATESDVDYIKQKIVNDFVELADVVFKKATRQFEGNSLDDSDLANLYNDYLTLSLDIIEDLRLVLEYAPDNYDIWERIHYIASNSTARTNDVTKKLSFSYCLGESPSNKLRLHNQSEVQRIRQESINKVIELNPNPSAGKSQGCYIATAVYGDNNASEVMILREFRDYKLNTNIFGKLFVKFYYAISPKLADKISTESFGYNLIRSLLDTIVERVKNKKYW